MNTNQLRNVTRGTGVVHRTKVRRQVGATLIEVLVAVVVLAFGVVGMAGMQFAGIKYNHSASLRSQATSLAYDLADRARANLAACNAVACVYETPLGASFDGNAAEACGQPLVGAVGTAALAASDVNQWKSCVENALPGAQALAVRLPANTDFADQCGITHTATGIETFVVEVNWNDSRLRGGANARDCVVVRTEVRPI